MYAIRRAPPRRAVTHNRRVAKDRRGAGTQGKSMTNWIKGAARLAAAACAAGSIAAAAQSPPGAIEGPGALLYSTHCSGCHTTQAHWRDGRLVTDWASLDAQVRRWQNNGGLRWSNEDVAAVVRYLNAAFYRFPAPERRAAARADAQRASAMPG
jgi:mono/diheme cytochrome c family protein